MVAILKEFHEEVLKAVGESELNRFFTWSGGTALSYFYLQHRLSYDLDFMSKGLVPDQLLLLQIREIAKKAKCKLMREHTRFNRHEFWLKKGAHTLKIEFIFYPFLSIKQSKKIAEFNLKVDSLEDILTNKIHALYERLEPKDVFDIYCILQKSGFKFGTLFKWTEKKFGAQIDPVLWVSLALKAADKLADIKPLVLNKDDFSLKDIKKYLEGESHLYLAKKIKEK